MLGVPRRIISSRWQFENSNRSSLKSQRLQTTATSTEIPTRSLNGFRGHLLVIAVALFHFKGRDSTIRKAGEGCSCRFLKRSQGQGPGQCRPKVPDRFAFPGARKPKSYSISQFGKNFPEIFPRSPPRVSHRETKGRFRKRVVLANVPSFRFSFQGNIRQNHPFGKPPFCEPPIFLGNLKGRFRKKGGFGECTLVRFLGPRLSFIIVSSARESFQRKRTFKRS